MEGDLLGLDLSVLNVDLVAHQDDGDVFTDSDQVLVPLGYILICNSGTDIEHNDSAVASNAIDNELRRVGIVLLVAVSETSEFLLSSSVPHVELDGSVVGMEDHGVHLDSECGDVFLFELSSQVSLDESCLSDAAVSDQHEFEFGHCSAVYHL